MSLSSALDSNSSGLPSGCLIYAGYFTGTAAGVNVQLPGATAAANPLALTTLVQNGPLPTDAEGNLLASVIPSILVTLMAGPNSATVQCVPAVSAVANVLFQTTACTTNAIYLVHIYA